MRRKMGDNLVNGVISQSVESRYRFYRRYLCFVCVWVILVFGFLDYVSQLGRQEEVRGFQQVDDDEYLEKDAVDDYGYVFLIFFYL